MPPSAQGAKASQGLVYSAVKMGEPSIEKTFSQPQGIQIDVPCEYVSKASGG